MEAPKELPAAAPTEQAPEKGLTPEAPKEAPATPPTEAPKTEEKQHEPQPGSPRWNEVYHQLKETQREMTGLREHNLDIAGKLNQLVDHNQKAQKNTKLAELERNLDQSFTDSDDAAFKQAKVELKTYMDQSPEQSASQPTAQPPSNDQNDEMQNFKRYNPWFEKDEKKTAAAMETNNQMLQDPYWKTVKQGQFLTELSRRTNSRFFSANNEYRDQAHSDGITSGPVSSPDEAVLSEQEKKIARNLFPESSEKEAYDGYRTQKQLIQNS